jgi:hypothetical protein
LDLEIEKSSEINFLKVMNNFMKIMTIFFEGVGSEKFPGVYLRFVCDVGKT